MEEYFDQFTMIVGREGNIPLCVLGVISQLSRWHCSTCEHTLRKYRAVYTKYAPRLANAYHRKLIAQPVEYSGRTVRTLSIMNLAGWERGVLILNSDQPIFSLEFLNQKRPALTNICMLLNSPAEFFYKIGIRGGGIIRSGIVRREDYTALPPRTDKEIAAAKEIHGEDNLESIMPGRYFVDLQLDLDNNPLLFQPGVFYIDDVLFMAARCLTWQEVGAHMEPTLIPDLSVIIDNFTHIIAHFRTADVVAIPANLERNIANARKFALVREIRPPPEEVPRLDFTADMLLE